MENEKSLPKLFDAARGAVEFVALVGTVVLSIAAPGGRDAVAIVVDRVAVAIERRCAGEMVGSAGGRCAAVFAVLQQHQAQRTRAHLVRLAVVHRGDADVRAFVLRRHAQMVFDDLRFRVPNGDDVGDVRVLLLQPDGLAADRCLLQAELVV